MLKVEGITVCYGARTALEDASLEVRPGEILALIGPNGSGKSTLIRAASGVIAPRRGRVTADGEDVHGLRPALRARKLAVVPQAVSLPEAFTARETVLLGRTAYLGWLGHETPADREAAAAAMERTRTAGLAARRLGDLSGGERQLVLVARALAQRARFLLMDEPTAHLDLRHEAAILGLARELAHSDGLGVLVALHDLNLAARHADRAALLDAGRIAATGSPAEVLTPERLSAAYGTEVEVVRHPDTGLPVVSARLG
ncbi:MAG: ABC transporter ATP-binding protein [Planctomycetes bacterium]|nr:ABC transporter ATP-binding protein [Planctomycetota bacterium]